MLTWFKGEVHRITEEAFDRRRITPEGNLLSSSEL